MEAVKNIEISDIPQSEIFKILGLIHNDLKYVREKVDRFEDD